MARKYLSALFALLLVAGAAPVLSGCNTTAGVGEDIEATGEAITDTAEDAQQ